MQRFLDATESEWADLAVRARGRCVVFSGCALPEGAYPGHGRVGVEIAAAGTPACLLVDRAEYSGGREELGMWLRSGSRSFGDLEALREWVHAQLGAPPRPEPSHVPVDQLTDLVEVRRLGSDATSPSRRLREDQLLAHLQRDVRGQSPALKTLARRVVRHVARRVPSRPLSLFAVGPSGVGKTLSTEVLADALASMPGGSSYGHLRLDMAEYQERHRVSALFGAPPGYVGHDDGALLVDTLTAHSATVVVFDEIDKAHPDILRALLQALDAGRLGTGRGRSPADCRRAIFVFTSNREATEILTELERRRGFDDPATVDEVCRLQLLRDHVAPEIVGRVGCFLAYRPLDARGRAEVAALAVVAVGAEYGVNVVRVDPEVLASLLRSDGGALGARPDRVRADDLLGAAFVEAADCFGDRPVAVRASAPPRCELVAAGPSDGASKSVDHPRGT